jgi:NTP pyrophosphatase (non-canonical NTP hydrolase)
MTTVQVDYVDLAVEITKNLRAHFPDSDERIRQVLAIAEEAGEVQEAYLLWLRGGPQGDVAAELADVIITAYVTAVVLGIDLTVKLAAEDASVDAWQHVMGLGVKAGGFVGAYGRWAGLKRRSGEWEEVVTALEDVAAAARATAGVLGVDLDAAVQAKATVIRTRGWRDAPAGTEVSQ